MNSLNKTTAELYQRKALNIEKQKQELLNESFQVANELADLRKRRGLVNAQFISKQSEYEAIKNQLDRLDDKYASYATLYAKSFTKGMEGMLRWAE